MTAEACESTVIYVRASGPETEQGWQEFECTLPPGHRGHHSDGDGFAWTDPWGDR